MIQDWRRMHIDLPVPLRIRVMFAFIEIANF